MSNLRDFSSKAYDELCQVIDTGIGEYQFGDFFKHIFSSEINFDKYTGSISEYYKSIVDKHSIDEDTLKRIFKNVSDCDDEFRENLSYNKEQLDRIKSCLNKMVNMFEQGSNGKYVFESDDFSSDLSELQTDIIEYYFKSFYYQGELNTEAISKIMNTNPNYVSDEEYAALAMVMCQFTKGDENGKEIINVEMLEDFINCSYIDDDNVKLSEVFINATSCLAGLVSECYSSCFGYNDYQRSYL